MQPYAPLGAIRIMMMMVDLFSLISYEPYTSKFKGQIFSKEDFPHTICMAGVFHKAAQLERNSWPLNIVLATF